MIKFQNVSPAFNSLLYNIYYWVQTSFQAQHRSGILSPPLIYFLNKESPVSKTIFLNISAHHLLFFSYSSWYILKLNTGPFEVDPQSD